MASGIAESTVSESPSEPSGGGSEAPVTHGGSDPAGAYGVALPGALCPGGTGPGRGPAGPLLTTGGGNEGDGAGGGVDGGADGRDGGDGGIVDGADRGSLGITLGMARGGMAGGLAAPG